MKTVTVGIFWLGLSSLGLISLGLSLIGLFLWLPLDHLHNVTSNEEDHQLLENGNALILNTLRGITETMVQMVQIPNDYILL